MQQHSRIPENEMPAAALFDRYGPLIFAYILKHIRIREDAEDLTLEVFTAALENQQFPYRQVEEQLAWLKRVAHNKVIDAYRKSQHRMHANIDSFTEILYDHNEPEHIILLREVEQQLHQHIQQLSPFQQQLLYLRYAHGLRATEIAILLDKSANAIRQQLTRTRTLLRTIYHQQGQKGEQSC